MESYQRHLWLNEWLKTVQHVLRGAIAYQRFYQENQARLQWPCELWYKEKWIGDFEEGWKDDRYE